MTNEAASHAIQAVAYIGGKSFTPGHLLLGDGLDVATSDRLISFLEREKISCEFTSIATDGGTRKALALHHVPGDFKDFLTKLAAEGLASDQLATGHVQKVAEEEARYTRPFNPFLIFKNTFLEPIYNLSKADPEKGKKGFQVNPAPIAPLVKWFMKKIDSNPEQLGGLLYGVGDVVGLAQNPVYNRQALRGGAGDGEGIFYGLAGIATGAYLAVPENSGSKASAVLRSIAKDTDASAHDLSKKPAQMLEGFRENGAIIGNASNAASGFGLWLSSFKHHNPFTFVQGGIVFSTFTNAVAMAVKPIRDAYVPAVEGLAKLASPLTSLLPQSVRHYVGKNWEIAKIDSNHSISYNKNHNLIGFISMGYQLWNASKFRTIAESQINPEQDPRYACVKAEIGTDGKVALKREGHWKDLVNKPLELKAHMAMLQDGFAVVSAAGIIRPLSDDERISLRASGAKEGTKTADGGTVMRIPHAFDEKGWNTAKEGKTTYQWRYDATTDRYLARDGEGRVEREIPAKEAAQKHLMPGGAGYSDYFNTIARYQTTSRDPLATAIRFVSTAVYLAANGVLGGVSRPKIWMDQEELFSGAAMMVAQKIREIGTDKPAEHQAYVQQVAALIAKAIENENEERSQHERKERLKTDDPSFTLPRMDALDAHACAQIIADKIGAIAGETAAIRRLAEAQLIRHTQIEKDQGNNHDLTMSLMAKATETQQSNAPVVDITKLADLIRSAAASVHAPSAAVNAD